MKSCIEEHWSYFLFGAIENNVTDIRLPVFYCTQYILLLNVHLGKKSLHQGEYVYLQF